jgi:hypothetical protein
MPERELEAVSRKGSVFFFREFCVVNPKIYIFNLVKVFNVNVQNNQIMFDIVLDMIHSYIR